MMTRLRPLASLVAAAAAGAVVVAAIALALPKASPPGDAPSGSTEPAVAVSLPLPTPAIATQPPASAESSVVPCCSTSPTPLTGEVLEESDRFWETWLEPIHIYLPRDATSLADATRQADLVVRGRMTDLYIGEYWRTMEGEEPYPIAYIKVEIEEVLKGEPVSRTPGAVEVGIGQAGTDLEEIRARLPAHDNVWFLMYVPNLGDDRELEPQRSSEILPFSYLAANDYQGVLRDINGAVRAIGAESIAELYGPGHFPLPLDGTNFEQLVELLRGLAQPALEATPPVVP